MPGGLKRFQKAESLHFITFSCFDRVPLLEARGGSMDLYRDAELLKDKRGIIDGRQFFSRSPFVNHLFLIGTIASFICIIMAFSLAILYRDRMSLGIVWVLVGLCGVLPVAWLGAIRHIKRLRSLYKEGLIGTVDAGSLMDVALGVAANAVTEWLAFLSCTVFIALAWVWLLWGMRLGR
jgi:hypothetical protein